MNFKGFHSLFLALLLLAPAGASGQVPYQVIHTLSGDEGFNAQSGLVKGADGQLYGTATGGGAGNAGTIYRIEANGTFTVIHTFQTSAPQNGMNPVSLIRGRDKHLYGTTEYGGTIPNPPFKGSPTPVGDGMIYRLNWNGKTYSGITILHEFDCSKAEGGAPWGSMIEGPDGALYGVTAAGDFPDPNCTDPTTVYKINKDGTGFKVVASFDYMVNGAWQFGPLAFGSDGSIFGTLAESGNPAFRYGSVFKISADETPIVTYPKIFDGTDGIYPTSGLVRGIDGAFYGTTAGDETVHVGTIFRIDEEGVFTSLYSFDSGSIHTPNSPLVVGGDGTLYGAAHLGGGPANAGGSYIFDPAAPIGTRFTLHSTFDHVTTGSSPWGPLGVGVDRHLYGTQSDGGAAGQGTLFGLLDINVVNRPPVPYVMASPNPAEATTADGATVSLSALGSSDADFDDLTYSWDLPPEATHIKRAPDRSTLEATFPVSPPLAPWTVTLNVSDGISTRSVTTTITVIDSPPTLGVVQNVEKVAFLPTGVPVHYAAPTATDIVDGDLPVTCQPASGSTFVVGPTTVKCSATDSRGQTTETSFLVTVTLDAVPPVVTVIDVIAEATGPSGAVVDYSASVSGSDNGVLASFICTPSSPDTFALGSTEVTCTATDGAGNSAVDSFFVHVTDTTGPTIVASDIVVASTVPVPVSYSVTASDAVDGVTSVSCSPASGSTFPVGVTTVECTSADSEGNSSTSTFTVAVLSTPPTLTFSPGVLWPPNHKLVTVKPTIVMPGGGPVPDMTLVSITSNEPHNGLGDGDTAYDIQGAQFGTDDREFQLRAERSAKGPGRIYTVAYDVGGVLVTATVTVPHDMSGKKK